MLTQTGLGLVDSGRRREHYIDLILFSAEILVLFVVIIFALHNDNSTNSYLPDGTVILHEVIVARVFHQA